MQRMLKAAAAVSILGLSACATTHRFSTPSGRPEVTIPGATKKQVSDALAERLVKKGWAIGTADERTVTASKKLTSLAAALAFGSRSKAFPNGRATYDLLDAKDGVRVVGRLEIVTNPETGGEQVTDATDTNTGTDLQEALRQVAASLKGSAE